MSLSQHISYDALSALKEVMEDDFIFLIDTFIQDSQERLAVLQELQGSNDAEAIRRAAHSFKGSCSNLGALRLAAMCAELEGKALAQDLHDIAVHIAAINAEFLIVKQMMLDFIA